MRAKGAEHEAIRLLYHLWGDWPAEIASAFGLNTGYVRDIITGQAYESRPKTPQTSSKYHQSCQKILAYIDQNGPISRRELQSIYPLPDTSILRRLGALQRQGKITREGCKYAIYRG